MICIDCRKGGEMNWLLTTDTASTELTAALEKQAKLYHSVCKGGTWCDCQHKLGKVLSLSSR